jgi:hypothetical protein
VDALRTFVVVPSTCVGHVVYVAVAVSTLGCNQILGIEQLEGGYVCGTTVCANDPPISPSVAAECNKFLADPRCGLRYRAAVECVAANPQCTPAGTSPDGGTTACGQQTYDWIHCVATDGG